MHVWTTHWFWGRRRRPKCITSATSGLYQPTCMTSLHFLNLAFFTLCFASDFKMHPSVKTDQRTGVLVSPWQPDLHPAGPHAMIYCFGNIEKDHIPLYTDKSPFTVSLSLWLGPADLFNHPGALRQDLARGESLHLGPLYTICPAPLIPPSLCGESHSVHHCWPDTATKLWKTASWIMVFIFFPFFLY